MISDLITHLQGSFIDKFTFQKMDHFLKNAYIQTTEEWSGSANHPVLHYEDIPLLHKVQIQFRNSGNQLHSEPSV